ncbi:drebrin-like protein isoform X2 [Tachysurus vachellii]|uniref:drebrin-like protein isoform X2 n=1 Tax=Tachysurus vachellii TaxID=175792 RepID=UPI00296B1206|nr:drebrin-like protein isoform X2 [Tachysurus vachellii]
MMAVNLSKHGTALSDAYTEVVDGKTGTNWVLFTYEGNSYDIQVASKGGGGLYEMVQELNAGKVMYAFCRVTDPNSGVTKFILINWTGEGVTGVRRGVCSNHLYTMASFLRGAHVTINAHSEDDVEPELIMNKVSQAVGVNYSVHTETNRFNNTAASHPVGSAYCKTHMLQEIKETDRETFWAQMEKEEQARRQQERMKAEEERQRLEKERKEQEERETVERERRQRERAKQINQLRLFEKRQESQLHNQQQQEPVEQEPQAAQWKGIRSSRSVQEANKEEQTHRHQEQKKEEEKRQKLEKERKEQEEKGAAERERWQRERAKQIDQLRLHEKNQELKNQNQQKLVEQEPQAAQWKGIRSSRSVQEANNAAAVISQRAINPRDIFIQKETNVLTNRASASQPDCNEENRLEENAVPSHHRIYEEVEGDTGSAGLQQNLYAKALYDYQAADDTELTFDPGDIITVVEMTDEGWWHGYGPSGNYGMFPANYVELI